MVLSISGRMGENMATASAARARRLRAGIKKKGRMRAILVDAYGGSDRLKPVDVPVPNPGRSQVLVRQSLAGVNFIDVYVRQGIYRHSETYPNSPPFRPDPANHGP